MDSQNVTRAVTDATDYSRIGYYVSTDHVTSHIAQLQNCLC
jgi:hypothetical protein